MAVTRLSDAIIPPVFLSYTSLDNPELTSLWQSGIAARSGFFDGFARNAGKEFTLPFWQDLDPNVEPNMSNDDPDDMAVPQKVTATSMRARKSFLNQGWADMDLVVELTGSDPMRHVANRVNIYWRRQWQRRLIATLQGVYADNVANDAGDMTVAGGANPFTGDMVIDAAGTMGDALGVLGGIVMHSKVHTRLVKNDEIVWVPDSEGKLTIPTYKELRVVVDDSMPIVSGSGATAQYLTVLFGTGSFAFGGIDGHAFAYGEGLPKVPVEFDRTPRAGNGGGMEEMWMRKTWVLHPFGYDWIEDPAGTGDDLTEFSPTLADLRKAAHWDRKVYRKQVPLAFITSQA
nr:putative major capsid protein [Achromobacter phage vB_Ade_ART]